MKNLASLCFAAALTLISALISQSAFASALSYSCTNMNVNGVKSVQSLVFESRWLLQDKIFWTSLEGYRIEFPGKTTPAEGLDFGFKDHQFEFTSLNNSFLGIYVEHSLYIDQQILKGAQSGFVVESTSYGGTPESISSDVTTFSCARKLN